MFFRTHLVIALFFVLIFFSYIENPILFLSVVFFATLIPDIDSKFSKVGHYKIFRIFNFFTKHRGIMHSFSFLVFVSFLIFLSFREILLPFALAYSLHLLLDAITIHGISPLYPLKFRIKGKIRTGGIIENFLFVSFIFFDFLLVFSKIYLLVK
jgi:membrane-bound metal-dependent hydrolase YbcI (DUF457 family)